MRKEINRSLERKGVDRQYVVNITQLHEIIHDVNILFSMINGKKEDRTDREDARQNKSACSPKQTLPTM